ncbi:NADPH-dependent 7-cyano-7-deazaguanine reductase QueF [Pelagibaculum spongiae]|uniref:NADPH-dependent 7-cyano-7-deazaguanine reductase QueF n=1 Tax=Pelagibaculum spongiae TaxID=2080658 RepID=UPI001F4D786E|nr:NADPH-dependent 7-cyano-7-deazaguanine reductase QueF [Pelagibaculum spongiae]
MSIESNPDIPLGKTSEYPQSYDPDLLFPIPRLGKRLELGIDQNQLPFFGVDIWNAWEVSWLNLKGKPCVAIGQIHFPAESEFLVESKSLKLYFNSLNQHRLSSVDALEKLVAADLTHAVGVPVVVTMSHPDRYENCQAPMGQCIDELDVEIDNYSYQPELLKLLEDGEVRHQLLYSHLLKSNCLVTGQPDWGSVWIEYSGQEIDQEALLKYLISFRNHNEFHEQCVERIFTDIKRFCNPQRLTVWARYVRRGGLDINPYRSNCQREFVFERDFRQ